MTCRRVDGKVNLKFSNLKYTYVLFSCFHNRYPSRRKSIKENDLALTFISDILNSEAFCREISFMM